MMQNSVTALATEIKVPIKVKENLETAAKKQGLTLVDFLIATANDAMEKIPEKTNEIRLSVRDQVQIAEALAAPPLSLGGAMQKAIEGALDRMDEKPKDALKKPPHARNGCLILVV